MASVRSGLISGLTQPAIFFDRDGTLNQDLQYPHKIKDLFLIPGAAKAVQRFNDAGYLTVIITNQSGIARGYFDEASLFEFNAELIRMLEKQGAVIDLILHCPHHPDITGPCLCRKPASGLITQACEVLPIDLTRSMIIGDRETDIECAKTIGIPGHLFKGTNLDTFCKELF